MNYTPPSVADVLGGQSLPSASFKNAPNGAFYEGYVVKEEIAQQTKMDKDRTPEFWDPPTNQRPKWQVIAHLQNPQYVTEDNPDGILRAFLKSGMLIAAQKAAKDVGVKEFAGGYMRITQTGSTPTDNGFEQKQYQVDFAPPANPVAQVLAANPQTGEVPPAETPGWYQQPGAQQAPPQQQVPQFAAPPQQQGGVAGQPVPQFAAPPAQQQIPQFSAPAQQQAPRFSAPPQAAPPQAAPPTPPPVTTFAAPAQQVAADPVGAMLAQTLGAVEITPLTPQVREYVTALLAAGMPAAEVASNLTSHNFPVTEAQVVMVQNGETPIP